jgi:hypothetical protein
MSGPPDAVRHLRSGTRISSADPQPTEPEATEPQAPGAMDEQTQRTIAAMQEQIRALVEDRHPALSEADVRTLEPFSGRPADLPLFLDLLRHVFSSQPAKFHHEKTKVDYAIFRLRGKAFDWVRPYLRVEHPPAWMSSFEAFAREIADRFEAPNDFEDAADRFCSLTQTSTVAAYAEELQECATILNCPNAIAVRIFYKGLKASLKDELISVPKNTPLKDYVKTVIAIDHSLRERAKERVRERAQEPRPGPTAPRTRATPTQAAPPVPLASRTPAPEPQGRSASRPARPPLTDEEKEYRRKNSLCLYCGDPGHIVHDCPQRPARPPARAAGAVLATAQFRGNAPAQPQ